ncbi:MAG: sigma factor-like helix-turn-helix DNA-binding protein [Minisyncoccia bacterium]
MQSIIDSIVQNVFDVLNPKQRKILTERFGLNNNRESTLQKIGDDLGITRERVRQIQNRALDKIKYNIQNYSNKLIDLSMQHLKNSGGIREHKLFLNDIIVYLKDNSKFADKKLQFIYFVVNQPLHYEENESYYSFWYSDSNVLKVFNSFVNDFLQYIKSNDKSKILVEKKYLYQIKSLHQVHYLSLAKHFGLNIFNDFGLSEWPEINPKSMRDKIYLILKYYTKPMHFTEIAKKISDHWGYSDFSVATVHNELLKDDRFVLVGRGIYGLSENGYKGGTAKDIICEVLKKYGPLTKQEIINKVSNIKLLKPNTILVNLQDKNLFKKLEDGHYILKKNV